MNDTYRPQWQDRAHAYAGVAPDGPPWYARTWDRFGADHVIGFLAGLVVGMILMRWQHKG